MLREFAAVFLVLPHHNPHCSEVLCIRCQLVSAANSTGVALGPDPLAVSRGEEVTCSEPGDTSSTEGDGGDPAANKAANRAMPSGVIRSVNSSCRSKSHLTELGELPRQLLPTKGVSIKHIPAQVRLSEGTV